MADKAPGPDEHGDGGSTGQTQYNRELRTVAKGGGLDLLGQIVQQLIRVIAGPVMGRLLGDAAYGLVGVTQRVVEVLGLVLRLGYPSAIVRYVSVYDAQGKRRRARAVVVGTLTTSLVLGCMAAAVLAIWPAPVSTGIYDKPEMSAVLRILALALPAMLASGLLAQATVAKRTAFYKVMTNLLGRIVSLAGILVLCGPLRLGARGAAFAFLVASSVGAAIGLLGTVRLFGPLSFGDFAHYDFKEVQLFALPLLLGQLSSFGLFRVNLIVGARWPSNAELGHYEAASRVAAFGIVGLNSIGTIFRPIIADLHHRGKMAELREMFQTATRWAYHLTIPVMLIAFFKAESILALWRPEFVAGAPVLRMLCIGQIVNVSVGSAGNVLVMSGYQWLAASNNAVMAVTNIVLCLVLTRSYGTMGMAVGATLATVGVNLLRAAQVWWLHQVTAYTRKVYKPLLAGAITCPLLLVRLQPWWLDLTLPAMVFILAYVAATLLLGIEQDDREILATVRRRLRSRPGR